MLVSLLAHRSNIIFIIKAHSLYFNIKSQIWQIQIQSWSAVLVSRVILKGKGIGNSLFWRNPILFTFLFSFFFSYLNNRLSPSTGWKIRENGGAVVSICIIRGWFLFLCICIINKFLARAFGHNFSTAASPFHFVSLRYVYLLLYFYIYFINCINWWNTRVALFGAVRGFVRPSDCPGLILWPCFVWSLKFFTFN